MLITQRLVLEHIYAKMDDFTEPILKVDPSLFGLCLNQNMDVSELNKNRIKVGYSI